MPETVRYSAALCCLSEQLAPLAMPSKHRISVNLSPDEYRELEALAGEVRVSKAWLGRRAIIDFLERHGSKGQPELPLWLARHHSEPKPNKA